MADDFDKFEEITPEFYQHDADDKPEIQLEDELDELSQQMVERIIDKMMEFMGLLVGHELHAYQVPLARRIMESVIIGDGEELTALAARQCLDGDTVVFRRDGSAVRLRNHEDAWSTGIKSTKRYKIHGGAEIIATSNHPVMTDKGWVPAGDLRVGDRVSVLTDWPVWINNPAGITEEHARFLGYMITDGSNRPNQSCKFTNINRAYLDEMDLLTRKLFQLNPKWYAKGRGYDILLTKETRAHGNPVKEFYKTLQMDHGFPTSVFQWNERLIAEFINRAWSGDGCVRTKGPSQPDVFLACGNDEVYARYWQALLLKIGVSSTVKREVMEKGTGTFHRLVLGCGSHNIRRFFTVVGEIYGKEAGSQIALSSCSPVITKPENNACPGYQRHLYHEGHRPGPHPISGVRVPRCIRCSNVNPKTAQGRSRAVLPELYREELDGEVLSFRRIVAIDDAGEREVFDVMYPDKGWFIAQGVQVHNSGKSETVADTVAVLMILLPLLAKMYPDLLGKFKDGFWVGLFAPTETQAETLFGRTITRLTSPRALEILGDPEIDDQLKKEPGVTKTMKFKNSGSTVTMMTANPRAKIESKSFHMTVIDECQDSEDFVVTKSISPMLAYFAGTMVKTGTPTTYKNNFYKAIQLNKRRQTERGSRQNHFQWDWKDVVKVNANYKKFIKREMLRLGEESDEFQMSFCCKWLLERGMFVTSSILENLSDKTQEVVKVWHKTPVVVGIDPARKTDSTVVTVVWVDWDRPDEVGYFDHRILNWLEIQGDDWEEQYFQITNFLANYDVLAIGIDANGVGDAVAQRLRLLMGGRCEVIGVTSSTSEQMKRYTHMQALIQRQLLHFPGHAKTRRLRTYKRFFQQMTDAEITYSGPNFKVAAPNETHAHDDYLDSLSLATSLSLDLTMPEVQVSANNLM